MSRRSSAACRSPFRRHFLPLLSNSNRNRQNLAFVVLRCQLPADSARLPVKMTSYRYEEKNYAVVPINADGSIDVRIVGSTDAIDVDIEKISTNDKLDVHLKSAETYSLNYAGPIEVKIK